MILRRKEVVRSLVPLLVFSLSPLYMLVSLMARSTPAQTVPASPVPLIGRLEVHGGKHILVDGNEAESGFTILDGQTLESSDCTSATVHLLPVVPSTTTNEIGQVELATNTKAVVNYSAGKVNVRLVKGCARVRIAREIEATIGLPDGSLTSATQSDTPDRKRAEICFPSGEKRDFRPSCIAPVVYGVIAGAAAALTTLAVVLPCSRGEDTSPDTPSGPCI